MKDIQLRHGSNVAERHLSRHNFRDRCPNYLSQLTMMSLPHNPDFKPTEFGRFKDETGFNNFTI